MLLAEAEYVSAAMIGGRVILPDCWKPGTILEIWPGPNDCLGLMKGCLHFVHPECRHNYLIRTTWFLKIMDSRCFTFFSFPFKPVRGVLHFETSQNHEKRVSSKKPPNKPANWSWLVCRIPFVVTRLGSLQVQHLRALETATMSTGLSMVGGIWIQAGEG